MPDPDKGICEIVGASGCLRVRSLPGGGLSVTLWAEDGSAYVKFSKAKAEEFWGWASEVVEERRQDEVDAIS